MEHWTEYTRFFTALLVIVDPFMAVPILLGLTAGYSEAMRRRVADIAVLTVCGVLVLAALSGEAALGWMGTSLGSFRVAGGIVLFLMALAMLQAEVGAMRVTPQEQAPGAQVAVVPLAVPLLAGPGAISNVIIAMDRSSAPYHGIAVIGVILLVCALLWLILRSAERVGRRLGVTGLNVINRVFGLILAAIAVEIIANGIKQLFPAIA